MEIVIAIVVMAVIYIVKVMFGLEKTNSADGEPLPRKAMSEPFPAVELLEPETKPAPQPAKKRVSPSPSIAPAQVRSQKSEPKPEYKTAEPVAEPEKANGVFKDKSEIKKAIIYSEIFNRKYN